MRTISLKILSTRHRVPYRTLARWVEEGIIEPEHRAGRPGVDIVLSNKNIVELENLIRLQDARARAPRLNYADLPKPEFTGVRR